MGEGVGKNMDEKLNKAIVDALNDVLQSCNTNEDLQQKLKELQKKENAYAILKKQIEEAFAKKEL